MGCAPWNELENFVWFIAQKDYKISDHKAAHTEGLIFIFGLIQAVRALGKNFFHFTKMFEGIQCFYIFIGKMNKYIDFLYKVKQAENLIDKFDSYLCLRLRCPAKGQLI